MSNHLWRPFKGEGSTLILCNRRIETLFDPYRSKPTAPPPAPAGPALTYAVGDDLQQVLCEQQVGQSQQAAQLRRELLQPILRDIQTNQSPQVPQLLQGRT